MQVRLSDPMKWNDDWYLGLSPKMKCVWDYLWNTCTGTGHLKVSFKTMSDLIGEPITREEFERDFADRIVWTGSDKIWIHGFIRAQYRNLKFTNTIHANMVRKVLREIGHLSFSGRALASFQFLKEFAKSADHHAMVARPSVDHIMINDKNINNKKDEKPKAPAADPLAYMQPQNKAYLELLETFRLQKQFARHVGEIHNLFPNPDEFKAQLLFWVNAKSLSEVGAYSPQTRSYLSKALSGLLGIA